METADHKALFRKMAVAARAAARENADCEAAGRALISYVAAVPGIEVVAGYMPIRTEIDPLPALEALHARGTAICMPVVEGPARPLVFRRWVPGAAMEAGAFGAAIPADRVEMIPDLLVTPLLAFDAEGYRLGYGGGYYDRTLARLRALRRTYAVGYAYEGQKVRQVPREPTDQRLDAVVTDRRNHLT